MTTPADKITTPERLRQVRGFASRIACESASDRWLRAALIEIISALLGDDVRHEDVALSGAWDLPPVIPVPIDASSRGAQQMRLQQPQAAAQPMRLQPAQAAVAAPAPAVNGARPAGPGGGMSIEQAVALANERRARALAAAPAPAPVVSVAPSNEPAPAEAATSAASAAGAAPAVPAIPPPEPAPDPTVPDPAGADFLTRLAMETAAEDQQNENT